MNGILMALFGTLGTFLITALGAAGIFFVRREVSGNLQCGFLGFAGGVMIAASVWSLLLPGAIGVYNLIIAKTFIQNSIPGELLEAARIDGCSDFMYFIRIVLPLSRRLWRCWCCSTAWDTGMPTSMP